MKLKVCGLKHESNITELIKLPIDYVGFIFYKKSPRFIEENLSFNYVKTIPKHIKKVGVFVNENLDTILNRIKQYNLDMVQLHGNESPELCNQLKSSCKVIKAFQIQDDFDFKQLENYLTVVDSFLFDNATTNYGGSGTAFNWQILKNYSYNIPFFLSGGISEQLVEEIKQLYLPQLVAIDINSKFEIEPGLKNIEQIKQFILKLNHHDN